MGKTASESRELSQAFSDTYQSAFKNLGREHGFEALEVEGQLPAELSGTLYRNGPALFDLYGRKYDHWFEGDGGVSAVRFDETGAQGAVRLVESEGLALERRQQKMLYGQSVSWPRRMLNLGRGRGKNTANTSVMMWQGRLFALMEAAPPTELHPDSLATIGETDLDGVVLSAMSAHPHRVASRKATFNFGVRYGRSTQLDLFELPDEGRARRLASVPLAKPVMLHDFIATEHHLVFFVAPSVVVPWRFMLQVGTFTEMFAWQPELGTEVIVVPIDRPDEVVRFTVDPFYQWHFANAFEADDGSLVVDACRYPDFGTFFDIGAAVRGEDQSHGTPGHLHRSVIDLRHKAMTEHVLDDSPSEFPRIDPRREGAAHRFTYLQRTGSSPAVLKHDAVTNKSSAWTVGGLRIVTEPVFVPHPHDGAEDRGWVLVTLFEAAEDRTAVAVLDAQNLEAGPVATCRFDHGLPLTFHGIWSPSR